MSVSERAGRAVRAVPFRLAAAALSIVVVIAVAACGGASGTASPAPSQAPASAAPAATAAGASGADSGSCGEATALLVKQHLTSTAIVSVTTEGGCHDTTIVTSLGDSDAAKALAICDSAAEIAYAGDLSSVTVTGASSKELAIGIKGQPCIGEP
jgi:hypothetical protein